MLQLPARPNTLVANTGATTLRTTAIWTAPRKDGQACYVRCARLDPAISTAGKNEHIVAISRCARISCLNLGRSRAEVHAGRRYGRDRVIELVQTAARVRTGHAIGSVNGSLIEYRRVRGCTSVFLVLCWFASAARWRWRCRWRWWPVARIGPSAVAVQDWPRRITVLALRRRRGAHVMAVVRCPNIRCSAVRRNRIRNCGVTI